MGQDETTSICAARESRASSMQDCGDVLVSAANGTETRDRDSPTSRLGCGLLTAYEPPVVTEADGGGWA